MVYLREYSNLKILHHIVRASLNDSPYEQPTLELLGLNIQVVKYSGRKIYDLSRRSELLIPLHDLVLC